MRVHIAIDAMGVPRPRTARVDARSASEAAILETGDQVQSWADLETKGWRLKTMILSEDTHWQIPAEKLSSSMKELIMDIAALGERPDWLKVEPTVAEVMAAALHLISRTPMDRPRVEKLVRERVQVMSLS